LSWHNINNNNNSDLGQQRATAAMQPCRFMHNLTGHTVGTLGRWDSVQLPVSPRWPTATTGYATDKEVHTTDSLAPQAGQAC